MKIIQVEIEKLIPYARNSRTHSDDQVAQIAASIKEFGWTNPILVDGENGIIAGHGRLAAARKLGMKKIPVIELAHLTETQKRALVIADNKLALNAGWDNEMLALELEELKLEGYDLKLTGFGEDEIDALSPTVIDGLVDEDQIPEVPDEPKTKLGDIYQLGNHRLMCGDSTNIDAIDKLMLGQKADLVLTDPPYSIETQGGFKGEIGKSLKKQANSIEFIANFEPAEFLNALPLVFQSNKFNAYIFCNKDLLPDYLIWARDNKISFNVLIWKKPNAIPIGDSHRPDIEYLLLFRKSAIWNNGIKDVNYSRCLEYGREKGLHPTMKPVALLENEIYISSNTQSIVLDFFGGSGSTLIACEKTNRHARLMELDPKYCDVIVKRWEDFTGKKAELVNGRQ